ncbi:MAG: sulfatase-like hydrolase/transferase, partial [Verrucomicrobiae bacterium]|nr:sulfatase-like hydrolase/transferase [Verrucomicrobiae bacterium]
MNGIIERPGGHTMAASRWQIAMLWTVVWLGGSDPTLLGQRSDPVSSQSPTIRPNVLMIAVDDLRPMLGCYGDKTIATPHIDALAERGMRFDRAYCQFAKCGPSRLSILMGRRPDSIGVFSHRDEDMRAFRDAHADWFSLPRWFKAQGYHTRSFGKVHHDGWDDPRDWSVPSEPGREGEMMEIVDETAVTKLPFEERAGVPTVIADRLKCPAIQSPDVPDETLF